MARGCASHQHLIRCRPPGPTPAALEVALNDRTLEPVRIAGDPRRLGPGQSVRFQVRVDGVERDAFVVRWKGALHAYLNSCRHQHLPLDFGDGHFFDEALDALVCCHHGARYRPDTGACVSGPCAGSGLTRLAIEERDGASWCVGLAPASGGESV